MGAYRKPDPLVGETRNFLGESCSLRLPKGVIIGLLRGGFQGGGSLIFPKVPQSSLGILRVPQLPPPPLNTPPLGTLQLIVPKHQRHHRKSW